MPRTISAVAWLALASRGYEAACSSRTPLAAGIYIGGGVLVLILIIIVIVLMLR